MTVKYDAAYQEVSAWNSSEPGEVIIHKFSDNTVLVQVFDENCVSDAQFKFKNANDFKDFVNQLKELVD